MDIHESYTDKVINGAIMFFTAFEIFDDSVVVITKDFKILLWSKGGFNCNKIC